MNLQRTPDETIHAFLTEGADQASTRLLESIRGEIDTTRQRARSPWRFPTMPRSVIVFAALAALVVVAGALFLIGPGTSPAPVPSASPSATAAATESVAPSSSASAPAAYPLVDGEPWILIKGTLVRPDGTDAHEILDPPDNMIVQDSAWSPDGDRVALALNGTRGTHLWIANADGTGLVQVTTGGACPNGLCTEMLHPAWSPDGESIAAISSVHDRGSFVESGLSIIDVGSGATRLVIAVTDATLGRPTWSPEGARIAVQLDRYVGLPEVTATSSSVIAVVDTTADEPALVEITEPSFLAGYPSWHPTDDRIVVRTNPVQTGAPMDPNAPSDLYTVAPDGSDVVRVTQHAVGGPIVRAPTWTPDGRILYTRLDDPESPEYLRIIDADGTGEVSATGTVDTEGQGRWRPGT